MSGDDPKEGDRLLQQAYSLGTPDTHVDFYRDFAEYYDTTYAASLGYIYPLGILRVLAGQRVRKDPSLISAAVPGWSLRPSARRTLPR